MKFGAIVVSLVGWLAYSVPFTLDQCANFGEIETLKRGVEITHTSGTSATLHDYIWVEGDGLYLAIDSIVVIKLDINLNLAWAVSSVSTYTTTISHVINYSSSGTLAVAVPKYVFLLNTTTGSQIDYIGINGANLSILEIAQFNEKSSNVVFIFYTDLSDAGSNVTISRYNFDDGTSLSKSFFPHSTMAYGAIDHYDNVLTHHYLIAITSVNY